MLHRMLPFLAALTFAISASVPAALAYPGRWNVGSGMGDVELLYGRFGDHEIYVGCDPSYNTLLMRIGLVAPRSHARGRRQGVMVVRLGDRELRFAGMIDQGIVELIVPGSEVTNWRGQTLVSTEPDPSRLLHVLWIDNERRSEIDAFLDLLITQPGEPVFITIEGEPGRYRIGPDFRVRSARAVREECPALPTTS